MPITRKLLLSNFGAMSAFQEPSTHLCRPSPRPEFEIPAQTDPSGAAARTFIPASATLDLSPDNSYEVDEPGFHRTRAVLVPIQRYPELSPVNVPAYGGTPSLGP